MTAKRGAAEIGIKDNQGKRNVGKGSTFNFIYHSAN
jgi:hypothetical protein